MQERLRRPSVRDAIKQIAAAQLAQTALPNEASLRAAILDEYADASARRPLVALVPWTSCSMSSAKARRHRLIAAKRLCLLRSKRKKCANRTARRDRVRAAGLCCWSGRHGGARHAPRWQMTDCRRELACILARRASPGATTLLEPPCCERRAISVPTRRVLQ